jgi:8-oxo-dGTP pyrophosphatase MutT (NUDIX family)
MKKETSAGVILYNNESKIIKFLLLKYPGGHWDFVKGKMEANEESKETSIRETQEETGLVNVEYFNGFKEEISYTFFINKEEIHKKVIFYLGKTNSTQIIISHEHLDFIWLDFEEAMKKTTFENAKKILTKANNLLEDRV